MEIRYVRLDRWENEMLTQDPKEPALALLYRSSALLPFPWHGQQQSAGIKCVSKMTPATACSELLSAVHGIIDARILATDVEHIKHVKAQRLGK